MKSSPTKPPGATVTDTIRRVVTTHDRAGKTVLLSDDRIPLPSFPGGKAKGAVVWTTGTVPADNIGDVQGEKRAAGMSLKGGSVLRITEFGPGFISPMHRTLSIDYAVVLSGVLELVLDGGQAVKLRRGDVVIQRGTNHAWRNPSPDRLCRIMIAMIAARPVTIAGKRLNQTPTRRMIASVLAGTLQRTSTYNLAAGKTPVVGSDWRLEGRHRPRPVRQSGASLRARNPSCSLPQPKCNRNRALEYGASSGR
jgi:quercetin dioxygenase-like cupin family protein